MFSVFITKKKKQENNKNKYIRPPKVSKIYIYYLKKV